MSALLQSGPDIQLQPQPWGMKKQNKTEEQELKRMQENWYNDRDANDDSVNQWWDWD